MGEERRVFVIVAAEARPLDVLRVWGVRLDPTTIKSGCVYQSVRRGHEPAEGRGVPRPEVWHFEGPHKTIGPHTVLEFEALYRIGNQVTAQLGDGPKIELI
jgi:hypothetical protein